MKIIPTILLAIGLSATPLTMWAQPPGGGVRPSGKPTPDKQPPIQPIRPVYPSGSEGGTGSVVPVIPNSKGGTPSSPTVTGTPPSPSPTPTPAPPPPPPSGQTAHYPPPDLLTGGSDWTIHYQFSKGQNWDIRYENGSYYYYFYGTGTWVFYNNYTHTTTVYYGDVSINGQTGFTYVFRDGETQSPHIPDGHGGYYIFFPNGNYIHYNSDGSFDFHRKDGAVFHNGFGP